MYSSSTNDHVDTSRSVFHDESTDCAICLEPLYGDEQDESNNNDNVITLNCGHKWHFDCLVQQLQTARPKADGRRLLFRGCTCAKCGTVCDDHPRLTERIGRSTDRLRKRVDEMLTQQIQEEAPDVYRTAQAQGDRAMSALLEEGRRRYAFYLCAHCEKPYFGGTVECADEMVRDEDQNGSSSSSSSSSTDGKLCPACSPQTQVVCHNPLEHGRYLVWKCRYCCQPASHLCYGNVHFCDSCHGRNSARVRARNSTGRNDNGPRPPPLQPIPCVGISSCGFPRNCPNATTIHDDGTSAASDGNLFHKNGNTIDCEQVYYCALCDSNGGRFSRHGHQQHHERQGSENLIQNPSGANGMAGWHHMSRRSRSSMWEVEQSDLPLDAETTTNFVSSFQPCIMTQVIDLDSILKVRNRTRINIEVSAFYTGRTDCPSIFAMQAFVFPAGSQPVIIPTTNTRILKQQSTSTLQAPPGDYWERAVLDLEIDYWKNDNGVESSQTRDLHRPRFVQVVVMGKDSRFWQGRFGSKVAGVSFRILGDEHELQNILSIEQQNHQVNNDSSVQHDDDNIEGDDQSTRIAARRGQVMRDQADRQFDPRGYTSSRLLIEVALPVVCFVLLAWLTQK